LYLKIYIQMKKFKFSKFYWSKFLTITLFVLLVGGYSNVFAVYTPEEILDSSCPKEEVSCILKTSISILFKGIATSTVITLEKIKTTTVNSFNTTKQLGSSLTASAFTSLKAGGNSLTSVSTGLASGWISFTQGILNNIKDSATSTKEFAVSVYDGAKFVGNEIADGIVSGITSQRIAISAWGRSLPNRLVSTWNSTKKFVIDFISQRPSKSIVKSPIVIPPALTTTAPTTNVEVPVPVSASQQMAISAAGSSAMGSTVAGTTIIQRIYEQPQTTIINQYDPTIFPRIQGIELALQNSITHDSRQTERTYDSVSRSIYGATENITEDGILNDTTLNRPIINNAVITTSTFSGTSGIYTGDVSALTFNGNTFTTGTGILTIGAGKTLIINNSITLTGTDSTTMTFPTTSATLARTDAGQTFTGHQTIEGVTSTGATGTGKFVFDTTPTLITPVLGDATYTTLSGGNITDSQLTPTRLTFAGIAGLLSDDADLTFATDTLSATKILTNSVNGITLTSSTGTLSITNLKTLTVSDSTTLATNSITLAGGEVITFSPTNALSLLTTAGTSVTLPISGTLYGTKTDSITSANLLGSLSDETGTGAIVFANSPVFTTPNIGTATGSASLNLLLAGGTMTGNLLFSLDNTLDIGANGATRPRTGYFGTSIITPTVNATTALQINGTTVLSGSTLGSTIVSSSLTSLGTLTGLTVNSGTVTLSQDTNFVLSGGVNGVSFNTDTLSIDATNGRVGIGLVSPTANLQVAQSTAGVGTVSVGAGGTAWTGVGTQFLNTFKVGDTITSEGQTLTIATITTDTALATNAVGAAISAKAYTLVGGTRFSVLGSGNVGIGTTGPGAPLHIYKTSAAAETIPLILQNAANTAGTAVSLGFSTHTTSGYILGKISTIISGADNYQMAFSTFNSSGLGERMRIDNNGNVGIGTTSPGALLEVKGAGVGIKLNTGTATAGGWVAVYNSDNTAQTYLGVEDGTGGYIVGGTLAKSTIVGSGSNTAMHLVTNGTVRATILSGGNVGIGSIAPSGILSVTPTQYSTGTASQALTTVTGVGTTFTSAMVGSQFVFANGTTAGTITAFGSITSLTVSTSQTVASQAYNIAYTGLQVNSLGNVGIGTTGPSGLLHLYSTTAAVDNPQLILENHGGVNNYASILFKGHEGNPTGYFNVGKIYSGFFGANWTDVRTTFQTPDSGGTLVDTMTLKTGNVGIGTTGPDNLLHVYSNTAGIYPGIKIQSGSSANWPHVTLTDGRTSGAIWVVENGRNVGKFNIYGPSGTTLTIDGTGNVGIGTTNPLAKLDVAGYGTANSIMTYVNAKFYATGTGGVNIGTDGTSAMIATDSSGADMQLLTRVGGVFYPRLTITSAGNVGIGTTNPVELLSLGTTGTTAGLLSLAGGTTGKVNIAVAAAAGTWTMTLPTTIGTAGYQLTTAASDGVTSWAAAASMRELKDIIGTITDPSEALTQILSTPIYRFHYKMGMGTGDTKTEYVGVMADEAPWAMHFNGSIVNPVNTLGYMVLGMQATNKKISDLMLTVTNNLTTQTTVNETLLASIEEMNLKVNDLSSLDTTSATSLGSLIKNFLADVANNVSDLYASVIHSDKVETKELKTAKFCVIDDSGDEVCITKEELLQIKNSAGIGVQLSSSPEEVVSETCTDRILNQDETEVDLGGVCTQTPPEKVLIEEPAIPEVPTCTENQTLVDNICVDNEVAETPAETPAETEPEPAPTPAPELAPEPAL